MRQKYVISRNKPNTLLTIREYAVLDKSLNKVESSLLRNKNFSFLCEETYKNEVVANCIPKGINALVSILRTTNMFPIKPYAVKIAESVTTLYNTSQNGPVELFFDDVDLLPAQIA